MTLTARHVQTSEHEARHAACAYLLGADVVLVERRSVGSRHGVVKFSAPDVLTEQVVLLAPFVHASKDPDFEIGSHGADIVQALRLGKESVPLAIGVARECVADLEYRRLASAIAGKLLSRPVLGHEEIKRIAKETLV